MSGEVSRRLRQVLLCLCPTSCTVGCSPPVRWSVRLLRLERRLVAGVLLLATVGLLTFDTLWQGFLPPAWYLVLHLLEANLITPVLLGRRFTLNPVVIFVSLIFWMWLWGVPGALLSVPILVSIKVVCDRVPAMSPVSELLSR